MCVCVDWSGGVDRTSLSDVDASVEAVIASAHNSRLDQFDRPASDQGHGVAAEDVTMTTASSSSPLQTEPRP